MSAIDELKNGVVIDATQSNVVPDEKVESTPINMGGAHTIVSNNRVKANIVDIASESKEEELGVNIQQHFTDTLLHGEDSALEKYKREKLKEMQEYMAEKDLEAELKEEENDNTASEESEIGIDSVQQTTVIDNMDEVGSIEVEDISSLLHNKEEENLKMDEDDTFYKEEAVESTEVEEDVAAAETDGEMIESVDVREEKENNNLVSFEAANSAIGLVADDIDLQVSTSDDSVQLEVTEDESEEVVEDNKEILLKLQKMATDKLKPISKKLDISSFTVLKKPTANIKMIADQKSKCAKWVLPNQEAVVLMKEFSGSELEALREFSENSNSLDSLKRRYRIIYDHIISTKPDNFEVWLKSVPFVDVDHYFFAAYIASFKGANFLPGDCTDKKCNETFLTDDINIMDMVKFDDDAAKEKFVSLYQSEDMSTGKGIYCSEIVPLSNNVAVGFREPSIYNLFEISALDDKFKEKYVSVLEIIPYIDNLYLIDHENNNLVPIGYKIYPENTNKTIKSKIQQYANVMKTLTVDEFGPIKAYIGAIAKRSNNLRYVYPSMTCPKCGKEIPERRASAEELVFTRYQLGALTSTSLK